MQAKQWSTGSWMPAGRVTKLMRDSATNAQERQEAPNVHRWNFLHEWALHSCSMRAVTQILSMHPRPIPTERRHRLAMHRVCITLCLLALKAKVPGVSKVAVVPSVGHQQEGVGFAEQGDHVRVLRPECLSPVFKGAHAGISEGCPGSCQVSGAEDFGRVGLPEGAPCTTLVQSNPRPALRKNKLNKFSTIPVSRNQHISAYYLRSLRPCACIGCADFTAAQCRQYLHPDPLLKSTMCCHSMEPLLARGRL